MGWPSRFLVIWFQEEDDKPLVRPDRTAVSEDEDDDPLVQLPVRRESDMHGDEDDGPLAQPDHMVVSDEDDQHLVQPASKKKPTEEKRDTAIDDGDLAPLFPPNTLSSCTSSMARPNCHTGTEGVRRLA